MERVTLIPHHLLQYSILERIHGKTPEIIAQEMVDDTKRRGSKYSADVLGIPQNIEKYKTNLIASMHKYKERPDATEIAIGRLGNDDFCKACIGNHLHCKNPSQIFTELPPEHSLAKKFDAICAEEDDLFTEGFYRRLREDKTIDPDNKTTLIREEDKIIALTTLGIIRIVLQNTPIDYWRKIPIPAVKKMKELWKEIEAYYQSNNEKSA